MKKKAELTTQQIVGLIILIVSFAVILIFLFRLDLGQTTQKEVCHNSVVMKGQSVLNSGSLDCKTNYVCISSVGGGSCENFNEDSKVKIDLNSPDAKEQIFKAIAEEMADCWWMFGEGKTDYVGTHLLGSTQCAICSVLVFDSSIRENEALSGRISYQEFYNGLKIPSEKESSKTYLRYLYNVEDITEFEQGFNSYLEGYLANTLDFNKKYFVLTGRFAEGRFTKENWIPQFSIYVNNQPIPVTFLEVSNDNYDKIDCDEFLTKA